MRAQQNAHDGHLIKRELIGSASGTTNLFQTSHPYREGTLRAYVNGVGVGPAWEDGDGAEFRLDFMPTARSVIRATYIVDQGEGDE